MKNQWFNVCVQCLEENLFSNTFIRLSYILSQHHNILSFCQVDLGRASVWKRPKKITRVSNLKYCLHGCQICGRMELQYCSRRAVYTWGALTSIALYLGLHCKINVAILEMKPCICITDYFSWQRLAAARWPDVTETSMRPVDAALYGSDRVLLMYTMFSLLVVMLCGGWNQCQF